MDFKKEIGIGVFFLVLAVLYFIGSLSISTFDPFSSGREGLILSSRSVPQMLSLLVAVLSISHIVSNVLKMKKAIDVQTVKKSAFIFDRPRRLMVINILLIFAYIFCFTRLGFIVSTFAFLFVEVFLLIPAVKRKSWALFTVCFSIGVPVLLYLLFTKLLTMYLPSGLIG